MDCTPPCGTIAMTADKRNLVWNIGTHVVRDLGPHFSHSLCVCGCLPGYLSFPLLLWSVVRASGR